MARYSFNALTGGQVGAVDAINHTLLTAGEDTAVAVIPGDQAYFYEVIATTDPTNSPSLIRPISGGEVGWQLVEVYGASGAAPALSLITAIGDFFVGSGVGAVVKKTLAEVKTLLGLGSAAYTDSTAYDAAGAASGAVNTHLLAYTHNNIHAPGSDAETATTVGALIAAAAEKTTLAAGDKLSLRDSVTGDLQWVSPANLAAYRDTEPTPVAITDPIYPTTNPTIIFTETLDVATVTTSGAGYGASELRDLTAGAWVAGTTSTASNPYVSFVQSAPFTPGHDYRWYLKQDITGSASGLKYNGEDKTFTCQTNWWEEYGTAKLVLDATNLSTMFTTYDGATNVTTAGDSIGRIEDQSGNNLHFVKDWSGAGTAIAPVVGTGNSGLKVTAAANGQAIRYNGQIFPAAPGTVFTAFLLQKCATSGTGRTIFGQGNNSATNGRISVVQSNTTVASDARAFLNNGTSYVNESNTTDAYDNTDHVICVKYDGSNLRVSVDGGAFTETAVVGGWTPFAAHTSIGSILSDAYVGLGTQSFPDLTVKFLLVYLADIADADCATIATTISATYGA